VASDTIVFNWEQAACFFDVAIWYSPASVAILGGTTKVCLLALLALLQAAERVEVVPFAMDPVVASISVTARIAWMVRLGPLAWTPCMDSMPGRLLAGSKLAELLQMAVAICDCKLAWECH
jgi:hypothetical protein